jgi:hypothetical protein
VAVDRHLTRSLDTQPDFVTADLNDHNPDVVVDNDAFVLFSRQN